mgnify:CR=1 FL=1
MKKLFLLLLTLTFGLSLYSQKCKYLKNEVDEFTGSKIIELKRERITKSMGSGFNAIDIGLRRVNDKVYISLKLNSPSVFTTERGGKILFKSSTKEIFEFEFIENEVADYESTKSKYNPTNWYTYSYALIDNQMLSKLSELDIVKVRWYTTDGYIDNDVKKKKYRFFENLKRCIND